MSNPGAIATSPASMSGVLGVRPPKLVGLSAELRVAPQPATIEDNVIPSTHRRTFTHRTIAPLPDPFKCSSLRPLLRAERPPVKNDRLEASAMAAAAEAYTGPVPWRSALLSLGVLLLAGACAGRTPGTPLSFSTVELGVSSGIREPTRVVVRTSREWLVVWARHFQPVGAVVPPPVDFSREMVVGVFLDERDTGGYQIEIIRVERVERP